MADFNYKEWEQKRAAFKKSNQIHLNNFKKWLENKNLSEKTINNHITNIDFYINEFLCNYNEDLDISYGCYAIDRFLGNWFIRKALWSSCPAIKANASSIKKFYAFMLENGYVKKSDYTELCETIKEEMPDWLDRMKEQEDRYAEDDFF